MLQVVSRSQVKPRAVKAHQQVLDVRCCSCKPGYLRGQCTSDRYHVVQLLWVLHSVTSLQRYALGELNPCSSQYQLAAGDTTTATNIQEAGHHQRTSASRRRSSTPPLHHHQAAGCVPRAVLRLSALSSACASARRAAASSRMACTCGRNQASAHHATTLG
jgi:hypothetical protein